MSPSIATNTAVNRDELLAFLRERTHGILLTTRGSGRPQASPVTYGVDGAGRVVVATYPERAKARNAAHRPAAGLVALSAEFDGPWVQVDGTAEVVAGPDAVEALVEYYQAVAGEHPDWDEYRAAMRRQGKALLRLTVDSWGPVATGGFPARLA